MIDKLASKLGRNDEDPNIALAIFLCTTNDKVAIKEIVGGLYSKDKAIANDCIKVLYEIGQREPLLIKDYSTDFINLLSSKNNRLVWGSMTALRFVAQTNADAVHKGLNQIIDAYRNGSVITIDNSVSVLAELCKANPTYMEEIFPFLMEHLTTCRIKEVPQHAERLSVCINEQNQAQFISVLEERSISMSPSQKSRIMRLEQLINER